MKGGQDLLDFDAPPLSSIQFGSAGFFFRISPCIVPNCFAFSLNVEYIPGSQFGCAQRLAGSETVLEWSWSRCSLLHNYALSSTILEIRLETANGWACPI
jgi:hypothetical protein